MVSQQEIDRVKGFQIDLLNRLNQGEAFADLAEQFSEDPLRILRAMQFQSRLGLKFDPTTMKLMNQMIKGLLKNEFICCRKPILVIEVL